MMRTIAIMISTLALWKHAVLCGSQYCGYVLEHWDEHGSERNCFGALLNLYQTLFTSLVSNDLIFNARTTSSSRICSTPNFLPTWFTASAWHGWKNPFLSYLGTRCTSTKWKQSTIFLMHKRSDATQCPTLTNETPQRPVTITLSGI
jgi:hypothetical protein